MSSKDYILDITPKDVDKNVTKFTVRERPNAFYKYKTGLMVAILAVAIGYINYLVYAKGQRLIFEINKDNGLIAFLFIVALFLYCHQQQEESIVVIKNIGIQLHSQSRWKFLSKHDKNVFIPLVNIIDLVIHEGFYGYGQVIFYMCILTKNSKTKKIDELGFRYNDNEDSYTKPKDDIIKVVFSDMLPRKDILLQVWQQSREILFGPTKRYWRRVPGQGLRACN